MTEDLKHGSGQADSEDQRSVVDREQIQDNARMSMPMPMPTPMTMPMPMPEPAYIANDENNNNSDGDANTRTTIPNSLVPGAQQQQISLTTYPPGASPPTIFSPAPPPPYAPYVSPLPPLRHASNSHSRSQSQPQPRPHAGMRQHPSRRPSDGYGFDASRNADVEADSVIEDAYKEDETRRKGVGLSDGPHVVDCCAW